jgi:hypothetical protein
MGAICVELHLWMGLKLLAKEVSYLQPYQVSAPDLD